MIGLNPFFYTAAATISGSVLSVTVAAVLTFKAHSRHVPLLISYAVGALLGATFLDIFPEAVEASKDAQRMSICMLIGLLAFFLIERLSIWKHHCLPHGHGYTGLPPARRSSGLMLIIGDNVHNFCDGIIVAVAFIADIKLGIVTSIAIVAHEIPHELSNFVVLLHSGYSRKRALLFNLLSSFSMVLGALAVWAGIGFIHEWIPELLAIAGASMLYVATADLIPSLHKRLGLYEDFKQLTFVGAGVVTIWLATLLE